MNLLPWRREENHPLTSLQNEMNRLFEGFFSSERPLLRSFWGNGHDSFLPPVDVRETADKIFVEAELPGVEAKDLQIKLEGDVLWISGERRNESEKKTQSYQHLERSCGRFERQLTLPAGADPEKVDAVYKNGVLTIEIAKKEDFKPKAIQVKVRC